MRCSVFPTGTGERLPRDAEMSTDVDERSRRLEEAYDLSAVSSWILAGGFTRVALQMPDPLLPDAAAVAAALAWRCNEGRGMEGNVNVGEEDHEKKIVRMFVLADTTFGSCCVDEVAAAHHDADAIVHFGRACMSPVSRLPARFVFHKVAVDTPGCASRVAERAAAQVSTDEGCRALVVLVDQEHAHATAELRERLNEWEMTRHPGALPVVLAEPTPVEALPGRHRHRVRARARDGGGGCGCGGGGCGCGGGTCGTCAVPTPASTSQTPPLVSPARRRVVERVSDNLASLTFHRGGGAAGEPTSTASHEATAARVEAAAAAADPNLGAPYAAAVAEGMRVALSGAASSVATAVDDAAGTRSRQTRVAGQRFTLPNGVEDVGACAFLWVGRGESPALTQALSSLHGRCRGVAQYDPETGVLSDEATGTTQVSRVVKRRRYLIERAREARVVGIVAGTLGVAGYLTAIANLRALIAASGRKSYTVVAGKPNPQKLANFPEIEAFVMVSCEQTALIDGRDYLQPVITPWEAEVAFTHGKHWIGDVRLDFEHLLEPSRRGPPEGEGGGGSDDTDGVEFSFLGGGVRAARTLNPSTTAHEDEEEEEDDGVLGDGSNTRASAATQLALRAQNAVFARSTGSGLAEVNSGAEYLLGRRTYTGLEPGPKRGEDGAAADAPLQAAQGLKGRAHGYSNERP